MRIKPLSDGFGVLIEPSIERRLDRVTRAWLHDQLYSAHGGLLLFRGFDVDQQDFFDFTTAHGDNFLVHHNTEGRDYVGPDMSFATVAKSQRPIDFHIEMASSPIKPNILWLHCVAPAVRLGRIGFAEGGAVLAGLTGRNRAELETHGLLYEHRCLPPVVWRPVWHAFAGPQARSRRVVLSLMRRFGQRYGVYNADLDADDVLSFDYKVAAVANAPGSGRLVFASGLLDNYERTKLGDGRSVPQDLLIEVRQATYQNAAWIDWRAGDVAVVDNLRVMHAREGFEDQQRRVLIRYSRLAEAARGALQV